MRPGVIFCASGRRFSCFGTHLSSDITQSDDTSCCSSIRKASSRASERLLVSNKNRAPLDIAPSIRNDPREATAIRVQPHNRDMLTCKTLYCRLRASKPPIPYTSLTASINAIRSVHTRKVRECELDEDERRQYLPSWMQGILERLIPDGVVVALSVITELDWR